MGEFLGQVLYLVHQACRTQKVLPLTGFRAICTSHPMIKMKPQSLWQTWMGLTVKSSSAAEGTQNPTQWLFIQEKG